MLLLCIAFFLTTLLSSSLSLLICDASCLTCTGSASNQCLTCQSALIPSSGSCVCPDGKYATSGFTACASCNSVCGTCTGPAATDCTGCSTGTFLYGGTCYTNCSSSNYFNTSTLTCQSCDPSCLTCNGSSSSSCSSCTSGTLVSGSCKCNSEQYKDSSYVCQNCDSTCKECSGSSSSNCTACATGLILQSSQCTCPTGTYLNLSPISCLNCSSLCQGCTGSSASSCTSCKNNMILTSSTCTCPTRTYFEATSISCQSCDSTCQECSGPSNSQCTSCRNNLQLSSGQCICPSNTYLDTTSMICVACDSSCQTCSGPASNQCTSCATSFSLSASGQCQCSSGCSCPDGTYFESTSLTCVVCHSSCTTCSGPASNQCLSCGTGESLSSGMCICSSSCTCADGTYFDSGTSSCAACDETCLTCSGAGSTECVLCKNNMVPSGGECVCSTATYLNSDIMTCLDCDPTCLECSGPAATQCNGCKNNMITLSSLECGCPSTYYLEQGTLTCKTCDTHCQECTGPEKSQCTSCESTQVLQNGYCWDICSSNQYRDNADGSCQDCDSSCAQCSGSGANECTSCSSDRDLISGECVIHCDSSCNTCIGSSASQCTSCSGSLVLQIVASNYGSCIPQVVTPIDTPVVTEKKKITNSIGYGSSSTDIKITMDQTIQNEYNSIISLIQLSIVFTSAQPSIDYSYSYSLNSNYKEIIISFTYSGHLLAGNILNVDYTSTSLDYYMANTLQQIRLQESYQYSTSAQNFINGTTAVATASSQANGVFSLTSSFALKTVHSMRSEIVEDMLSFFIYMNIDYPPNFVSFSVNDDGGDQFSFIPDLGEMIVNSSSDSSRRRVLQEASNTTESTIVGDNAIDRYVPSLIFLVNFGSTLTMTIIAFGVILLVEGLKLLFPDVDKSKHFVKYLCHQVLTFTSNSLRWSFMVNQFIAVYLNLAFFSMLEVSNVRPLKGAVGYIKYISGIIGLLVSALSTIVLPLLARKAFLILKKSKNKQENQNPQEKEFLRKFNIIYFPFNTEKSAQFMYPPLLVIRSFGFVLFLVFLQKAPLAQALYIIISTVLMIIFLVKVRPLKSKVQQILTILYEVCFLAAGTAALSIYIYTENHVSDITVRSNLGYTIICCSLTMTVLNIINMIIELSELKHVLKKCRKRQRVTPLIPLSKNVSESEAPHIIPLKEEDVVSDYPDDKVQLKKENLKTIQEEDNLGKTEAEISISNTARTGQAWSRRMLLGNPKLNFDGKSLNDTIENLSLHTTPSKATPMNNLKESRKLDFAEREDRQPESLVVTPLKNRNLLSLKTKEFFTQKEFISTIEELDLLRPEQQQKLKTRNLVTPKRLALNSKEALSPKELMFKFDSKLSKDSPSIIFNGSRTGEDLLKKRDGDSRKFDTERDIWVEDMGMNPAKSGQSGKGAKRLL